MAIFCSIITPKVEQLALELNVSAPVANNRIATWQSVNHTTVIPEASDLRKYFDDPSFGKGRREAAELALPRHLFVEYDPNNRILTKSNITTDNKIIILKFPNDGLNTLENNFFSLFKNHPELRDVVETTEEAYNFLLWRELYFIMYGDAFQKKRKEEAFQYAYEKAKKYKEKHPVNIIDEDTNNEPLPSLVQPLVLPLVLQPQQSKKEVPPLPVTKIISGALTGIDTLGLQIAREFGIPTGGNVPIGFTRELNLDTVTADMLKEWGLTEVNPEDLRKWLIANNKKRDDIYTFRTYLNVKNSDGTVYFSSRESSAGLAATRKAAAKLGKPFILNPTSEQLREFCIKHNIKTLNIAGSRGSHLTPKSTEIANNVLRAALAGNNKNAQLAQLSLSTEYKVEYKKNNQTYTVREDADGIHIINKNNEEVYKDEDDGNRRMILAKLELQKGAVTVNYNGNVFIVKTNGEILSGTDGRPVYQLNSEKLRDEIHKLAEEKRLFYANQRASQLNTQGMEYEYIGDAPMSAVKIKAQPAYTSAALTPELLALEQAKQAELAARGEYVSGVAQNITAALANDPNYVPNIDISKVTQFLEKNKRIKLIRDFTSQLLKDRTEQMARDFVDIVDSKVDEWLEERVERQNEIMGELNDLRSKGFLNASDSNRYDSLLQEFNNLTSEIDILNDAVLGKRFVINQYGLHNIISDLRKLYEDWTNYTLEQFEEAYGKDRGAYMKAAYEKIVDNFDALLDDASLIIEGNENFRVVTTDVNYDKGPNLGGKVIQGGDLLENTYESAWRLAALEDDEDGSRLTGNDGWSYKVRFVDPLTSLSREVRRVLGNIVKKRPEVKRVTKDGELIEEIDWIPETDDLGNVKYLNPEAAHAILISELSDMIDADDFVLIDSSRKITALPALERLVDKYPWVSLIIEQLKADDRLCSKFFHDFRKDFIPYWMLVYNDKEDPESGTEIGWQLIQMNKETALDSTITQITRNYELGEVLSAHSIYTASKEISIKGADWVIEEVNDLMSELLELDNDNYTEITLRIADVLRAVGLNTNRNVVSALLKSKEGNISGTNQARQILDAVRSIALGVKEMPKGGHLIDYFKQDGYYNTIAEIIGVVSELDHVLSFRQGDKSYYSYSAPNLLDTTIKKFRNDDRRTEFLERQFKQYDWFHKDGLWRNEWLRLIEEDEDVRFNLATKELNSIKLGKDDNDTDYKKWDESRIRQGFVREFFSIGINPNSDKQYAWYNVPIFSDSPVVKFIKFKRYTGDNYKQEIIGLLSNVVKQELDRIKLVADRKKGIEENKQVSMSNFDKNGDKFHFFPELNDRNRFNYNGNSFLELIALLAEDGKLEEIDALIASAIELIMEDNFQEFLAGYEDGVNDEDKQSMISYLKKEGVITTDDGYEEAMRNYFYNQAFATTQIIQITTTDLAYYKNDVDFQKRYKEVYAAGNKLNTNSKYGKKTERTVYLRDLIITSATYNDIKRSLNYAVEQGRIQSFDRDNILNKFKDINVADALAYRNLRSMRSVLDMMGKWDDRMEKSFQRFENGEWDMEDFNTVWLTIKPFMFTQIDKPAYSKEYLDTMLADGRIDLAEYDRLRAKRIKVPHQNKNSEFLLLATYAMVANSMGKSAKLKGLERFMKDNDIDVIQFESAVKAGCQGTIDISYSPKRIDTLYQEKQLLLERTVKDELRRKHEEKNKGVAGLKLLPMSSADIAAAVDKDFKKLSKFDIIKMAADLLLDNEKISQIEYNNWFESIEPTEYEVYNILNSSTKGEDGRFKEEVVHELPYDDYCVQLPTPEHIFDVHDAVYGSQFRNLIISDLPDDFKVTIRGKEFDKKGIIDLYQANIVENLLDGYNKASEKFQNIRTLQQFLLQQVKGNPKYGRDIIDALLIVTIPDPMNNGEMIEVFNIPLDNPITTMKLLELITSVFKNNVTKQTINGGACILVSDFGLTKELQVLRDEKTGAIKGIECYLPANSKEYYKPFLKEVTKDGKTWMELDIENMPMELRKIVGYRIPTEDKYSMAPLIIKGFLPQLNGSSIMLPADITQIAGSDFDVDKMFLMIPTFRKVNRYNMKEAWKEFYKEHPEITEAIEKSKQEWFESYAEDEDIDINDEKAKKKYLKEWNIPNWEYVEGTKDKFKAWFKLNKDRFYVDYTVAKEEYDFNKAPQDLGRNPQEAKRKRDNMLIDISFAILTHPDTALKINDPGNYDKAKIGARVSSIITDPDLLRKFIAKYNLYDLAIELDKRDGKVSSPNSVVEYTEKFITSMINEGKLEDLNKFIEDNRKQRSQLTLNTFIYNHKQNMTGGALIGMYANNTTMQAKFQASDLRVKQHRSFTINGRTLNSLHDAYNENGERISKNCANFSAASVDNVKDPVLADLMLNRKTANITGFMLRIGMTVNEISLFFALPSVRKIINGTGGLTPASVGFALEELRSRAESMVGTLPSNNDILKEYNVTSSNLMRQTIRDTLDEEASSEVNNTQFREKAEDITNQFKTFVIFANIVEMAEPLGDLTRISRADSPNGAIETSIAKASVQQLRVLRFALLATQRDFPLLGTENIMQMNYLKADMTKDQMREKLLKHRMPMLQAFYSLGIDLAFDTMSKHFSLASPFMLKLATELMINSKKGYIKDFVMNRFFNESVTFALSKTTLFGDNPETGDTYEQKREYYLYQFPKKFEKLILDNPDLKLIDIIKKLSVDEETGDIQMFRSGRLTPLMRESLMRSMDLLLFDIDNPVALKLAVDLFMYAYYKDGFRFGPNSFGSFFSSNFIALFPEVVNALRTLSFEMREGTFMDNYLPQFYANHTMTAGLPSITQDDFINGKATILENTDLLVNASLAVNPLTKGGFHPITGESLDPYYKYFRYGDAIYLFAGIKDMKVVYTRLYTDISDAKGVRYNANSTAGDIHTQLKNKGKVKQSKPNSELNAALQEIQLMQKLTQQPQLNALQLAQNLENSVGNFEGVENVSNLKAVELEQNSGTFNEIEGLQRNSMLDEYENEPWQSHFMTIEEMLWNQLVYGFEEPPILEQYSEEDGEDLLDDPMCKTGKGKSNSVADLENMDLPDF